MANSLQQGQPQNQPNISQQDQQQAMQKQESFGVSRQETASDIAAQGEVKNVHQFQKDNPKPVPYDRFQQVVAEKNAIKERMDQFENAIAGFLAKESKADIKTSDIKALTADDVAQVVKAQFMEVERFHAEKNLRNTLVKTALEQGAYDYMALSPFIPQEVNAEIQKGNEEIQNTFMDIIQSIKKDKPFLFKAENPNQAPQNNQQTRGQMQQNQMVYAQNQTNPNNLSPKDKVMQLLTYQKIGGK